MRALHHLALSLTLLSGMTLADGLDQLNAWLTDTTPMRARFTKAVAEKGLGPEVSSLFGEHRMEGDFLLQRPGLFRMEYRQPNWLMYVGNPQDIMGGDGRRNKMERWPLESALGSFPEAYLANPDKLQQAFTLTAAKAHDGLEWVLALPRQAHSPFRRIELGLAEQQVRQMVTVNRYGQRTHYVFDRFQPCPPL
ncbi:outer membrane lipoprotein carrier protein LolA [Leeia aquatica]|uniref:Outer membrane lipoprotein carrier protein LolA n=1 Tax=Leeia aquatica TaxID=2725557 RepID=A0A847S2I5_9NEIS|nr:outer membrane lipoprotein carrier protein LolA [Leeia aquatica]NLR73993.1 outer membrane lipoprotein carrier protein LolA [Leeia aquatica]